MSIIQNPIQDYISIHSTPKFKYDNNEISKYNFSIKLFESNLNNNQINTSNNINNISHETPAEFQIDENFSLCSIKNNSPIIFKDKIDNNENLEIIFKDSGTFNNSSNTTKTNESRKDKNLYVYEKITEFPEKVNKNVEKFNNLNIKILENSNFEKDQTKNIEIEKSKNNYKYNLPLEQDKIFEFINIAKIEDEDNSSSNSNTKNKNSINCKKSISRNRNQSNQNYFHTLNFNENNNTIYYSKNKKNKFNTINQYIKTSPSEKVEKYHKKKIIKHYPTQYKIGTSKNCKYKNKYNSNFNDLNNNNIYHKILTPNRDNYKKAKCSYSNKPHTIKNEKHKKKFSEVPEFNNLNNNVAKFTNKYFHKIKKWKIINHLEHNYAQNIDNAINKTSINNKNCLFHFKTNLNQFGAIKYNNKYFNENVHGKKSYNNTIISRHYHKNIDKFHVVNVNNLNNQNNSNINKKTKNLVHRNIGNRSLTLYQKPHKIKKIKYNNISNNNDDEIIKYSIMRNNKMNKVSKEFSITLGKVKEVKDLKNCIIENYVSTQ